MESHRGALHSNDPTVFAYDLLNEPFSARDVQNWTEAHDLIYDAIRSVDAPHHLVMEDGYKLEDPKLQRQGILPRSEKLGWENIVYSIHFYSGWDPEFTKGDNTFDHGKVLRELVRVGKLEQKRWQVPIYIGEFSTMHDLPNDLAGMKMIMTKFNRLGWHYSPWTFKYVNDKGEGSIWGVYQFNQPWERTPNMYRDSKESLLKLISRLGTENFSLHEAYGQVLREVLGQPVRAAK